MSRKSCQSCRYFDTKNIAGDYLQDGVGRCRRNPPSLPPEIMTAIINKRPDMMFTTDYGRYENTAWFFPLVRENDWCGEFKS